MTHEEVINLIRTRGGYTQARTELRQMVCQKLGCSTTDIQNWSQVQIINALTDGDAGDTKAELTGGDGKPIPEAGGGKPERDAKDGGGEAKPDAEQGQGKGQGKQEQEQDAKQRKGKKQEDLFDAPSEDELAKGEDELAELEREMEKKRRELDEKKRKAEEAKRKAEEERKRKAEEESKKGRRHKNTDELLDMLRTTGQAYLVGPAGTGKSTLAQQACKELFNVDDPFTSGKFAQISFSPDTTSGEMIGRSDINGNFHESEIVRVFRDGGVILFDEIDAADSSMLVKLNTALANGVLSTPIGMVKRNEKCYIVCTANTFGTGPDAMYVGRARLDAATLDRFTLCTIEVDYDVKLEECIAKVLSEDKRNWLMGFVKLARKTIKDFKLRRIMSTRFVINATQHLKAGKSQAWVRDHYLMGWNEQEKANLKSA